ncbi:MAG: hydroxymethylpyrimidine/phosphomethylpyrimidine kinase, partial [Saccharofermentans sp.]|nr:hydroxymethylpyrimidine/phosphomethylpyrimidine kinase [Saccharofermentans sp.]
TVLTISDSVEGTTFDLKRSAATIKDFNLDPLLVVPKIIYQDGSTEDNDVSEMLDYALGECDFAALGIGFLTEPEVITYIADKLDQGKKAPVICCPSLISDTGEILVSGEVYGALCDRLLKHADYLIVNSLEAEAFCGFECSMRNDFLRAAKKIYTLYGCRVFIKGGDITDGKDVLFEGDKPVWINPFEFEMGYEEKYSLVTALACEIASDKPEHLAVTLALQFVSGKDLSIKTPTPSVPKFEAPRVEAPKVESPMVEVPSIEMPIKEETEIVLPKLNEEVVEKTKNEEFKFELPKFTATTTKTAVPEFKVPEISVPVTSSLVTPGKSLRDLARDIGTVKTESTESAVTSSIKTKGDVVSIASPRHIFDAEVNNSITELQSLKDRLNNLNNLANSGK